MANSLELNNANHRNPTIYTPEIELVPADSLTCEEARWRILRVLETSHPVAVTEMLLQKVLHDRNFMVSLNDLRKELKFLEKKGLIKVLSTAIWVSELTGYGMDVARYSVDCPPGITRPAKI